MAASDNTAAAAADLRRLAAMDEATLMGALSYMGREPFRRLRRAVGRTTTPEKSEDEGDIGPGGPGSSSAHRLDPADNVANQVTASPEANVNNLDSADAFLAAVSSPAASMATQDPVWPLSLGADAGGPFSTSTPTAGFSSLPATAPTTVVADQAQPGETPPAQGEGTTPEGPPTPGATRSRANKILPTATGRSKPSAMADQIDTAAKPPTKAVPRKQPLGRPRRHRLPSSKAHPHRSKPPPVLRPEGPSTLPAQGPKGRTTQGRWRPVRRTGASCSSRSRAVTGAGGLLPASVEGLFPVPVVGA